LAEQTSSKTAVYAALAGNLLIALTKFVAAGLSGSSSMFSEAVHSVVDTLNEALLLYGYHRAGRSPDAAHPLGYGRELYFWSFIVALLLFALGAGVSIFQGILHVMTPRPIEDARLTFIVLGLSAIFEGASWTIALRAFKSAKGKLGYWQAFRRSKDPPSFMVLFEDSAALIGLALAALGIYAAEALQMPVFDGIASILIGGVLALTAVLLARESKGLLIGERASAEIVASIEELAESQSGVSGANSIYTVHLSPEQIVVALSLEFADELRTPQIEAAVVELERRIRERHPQVVAMFVKPQTPGSFQRDAALNAADARGAAWDARGAQPAPHEVHPERHDASPQRRDPQPHGPPA
jgi:cation diffusion facilitator family transporter